MAVLPMNTDEQSIGDVGETEAALRFKKWRWTADIIKSDFGEDLSCHIFINKLRTNFYFRCQVKSTCNAKDKGYIRKLKNGDFSVSIEVKNIRAWLFSYFPTILIVYDESTEELYWADPLIKIRNNLELISKESVSIRVSKTDRLEDSKDEIQTFIREYYQRLLKIDSSELRCIIFPVIMPGYRLIPFTYLKDINALCMDRSVTIDNVNINVNKLPTWTTIINTLVPSEALFGLEMKYDSFDLTNFIDIIKNTMERLKYEIIESEYLSFICTPIEMSSQNHDVNEVSLWKRELTDWWTFSIIESKVIFDGDYAFEIPKDFIRQVGRKAGSWEYLHHVNPNIDLAVQLFSSIGVIPSYINSQRVIEESKRRQYIIWECTNKDIGKLSKILCNLELVFKTIDEYSTNKKYVGFISLPFFNPSLGLSHMFLNWNDFYIGINGLLKDENGEFIIPGKQPSENIMREINKLILKDKFIGTEYLITEKNYDNFIPLNLTDRRILVHRFRITEEIDHNFAEKQLNNLKSIINKKISADVDVQTSVNKLISECGVEIHEILISWKPRLNESSVESYAKVYKDIVLVFDSIFNREESNQVYMNNTIDILKEYGEIKF